MSHTPCITSQKREVRPVPCFGHFSINERVSFEDFWKFAGVIGNLKKDLFKSFDMKDLGQARQILGMQILHDRKAKKL